MSVYESFLCGAASSEQLVQDAKHKVRSAAEPVIPGDSIGAQIRNASRELQLDYGLTRRAWYGVGIGPITYPVIVNAWLAWIERKSKQRPSPWSRVLPVMQAGGDARAHQDRMDRRAQGPSISDRAPMPLPGHDVGDHPRQPTRRAGDSHQVCEQPLLRRVVRSQR